MWHFGEDIVDENQDRRIKRKNTNHQESIRVLAPASARTARARRKTITIRSTRKTKKTIQTTIRRRTRKQAEEEEQQQQQQSNHFLLSSSGSRRKQSQKKQTTRQRWLCIWREAPPSSTIPLFSFPEYIHAATPLQRQ